MKFGICLPQAFAGITREHLLSWSIQADQSGFSSLVVVDRLCYLNYEPLMTLAAVAAVTERIELMTGVLIAPTREVHLLAKQVATLDQLSNGRLTLGVGVGNKPVDFQTTQTPFNQRGNIVDQQLQQMKRIWSGQSVTDDDQTIGPLPLQKGGPALIFGGGSPATIRRISRWGEGCILGDTPASALSFYQQVEADWKNVGRTGKPRFIGMAYVALGGADVSTQGADNVRDYYRFWGQTGAEAVAQTILTSPEALKKSIQAFEDIGLDELILIPAIVDVDQLSRIRDVIAF
jgi:alkanesulfonate monooxygenase SsuD/methylene tetrahydromethanopterin reductase-like flavin-dependent oxidoreductase (luciferase family)